MAPRMIFRMGIDLAMTISLLLLMSYQVTGEAGHEWLGTGMTLLFLIHIFLNKMWYVNLLRGKYNKFRILQTVINFLILFLILSSAISGIAMSKYVFRFLNLDIRTSTARLVHMFAGYWGFILMSVHLGMHWGMISGMFQKILKNRYKLNIILKYLGVFISLYGVYVFFKLNLFSYMTLRSQFVFFDFEQAPLSVFFEYFSIMGTCIAITNYYIKFLVIKKGREKDI